MGNFDRDPWHRQSPSLVQTHSATVLEHYAPMPRCSALAQLTPGTEASFHEKDLEARILLLLSRRVKSSADLVVVLSVSFPQTGYGGKGGGHSCAQTCHTLATLHFNYKYLGFKPRGPRHAPVPGEKRGRGVLQMKFSIDLIKLITKLLLLTLLTIYRSCLPRDTEGLPKQAKNPRFPDNRHRR